MSAIVDYSYYSETYLGEEADEDSFPALLARAEDVIGAMTRWQVNEDNFSSLPDLTQTLYRKALCAQVDFLCLNGLETLADGSGGSGFTVGKVSVQGTGTGSSGGTLRAAVSPMTAAYLEQTGLMNPQVATFGGW